VNARTAALSDFALQRIDAEGGGPVNRRIYRVVRDAILSRTLAVGTRLPSSRALAKDLGVSRNTVSHAYDQLIAEGYLQPRPGAGTFVADSVPDQVALMPDRPAPSACGAHAAHLSRRGALLIEQASACGQQWGAFVPGTPDVTQFPHRVWTRLHNQVWRRSRPELLTYDRGAGLLALREGIADHLRVARSVDCNAGQVMITTGIHQSIDLATRLLGEPGDVAWIEDPCYWGTRSLLHAQGLSVAPVPVDHEGMLFRPGLLPVPRFIFLTPSHQYPLGSVMSLARRRAFLDYAAAHGSWIVEDDYDSEFRYDRRPLASLQGLDAHGRVLYLGTFSKTLFPGLRIGFMVVPPALADAFATGMSELYRGGQLCTQSVLAEFIAQGHFVSHIRRMRVVYARRLELLRAAIARDIGRRADVEQSAAGLHLTLKLPRGCDDVAISLDAMRRGIVARALSRYYADPQDAQPGLILGYACVPDDDIAPAVAKLAAVVNDHLPQNLWRMPKLNALSPVPLSMALPTV
jgi:GntR family transcriptional regulator/MocR family aminotransferase